MYSTIGRGDGALLGLLDLPAALKLMKSYFSTRAQRFQIDHVLSDFANIMHMFLNALF